MLSPCSRHSSSFWPRRRSGAVFPLPKAAAAYTNVMSGDQTPSGSSSGSDCVCCAPRGDARRQTAIEKRRFEWYNCAGIWPQRKLTNSGVLFPMNGRHPPHYSFRTDTSTMRHYNTHLYKWWRLRLTATTNGGRGIRFVEPEPGQRNHLAGANIQSSWSEAGQARCHFRLQAGVSWRCLPNIHISADVGSPSPPGAGVK